MREIKFRGKRIDNGEWIYGSLIIEPRLSEFSSIYSDIRNSGKSTYLIYPFNAEDGRAIEIIPETVGQYTGLKDKNGRETYKGDIVKSISPYVYLGSGEETGKICTQTYQIIYLDDEARFGAKTIKSQFPKNHIGLFAMKQKDMSKYNEVIGNITDNPELYLKKKKQSARNNRTK